MTVHLLEDLRDRPLDDFASIEARLDELAARPHPPPLPAEEFLARVARGCAFLTFAYGIDGVSMEIAKYGAAIAGLLGEQGHRAAIHCVGGTFRSRADAVLDPRWRRTVLEGADGWDKWEGGEWFARLFHRDMPEGSAASREMADVIWRKALHLAADLVAFVEREEIGLLIPVNVNSNPGNFALSLAVVVASEVTACPVLNNNHDFFWEGGGPTEERSPGRRAGPRDHFFRNHENRGFFSLFRRVLPWNGRRWIQVNINPLQSAHLVEEDGFDADRVFTVGTALDASFFRTGSPRHRRESRRRLAHVLAGGASPVEAVAVGAFRARAREWVRDQRPITCALRGGATLDLDPARTLLLLQPTRVVPRKCIPRDGDLIRALLHHPPFRAELARRAELALVLLVTGPVPVEHHGELVRVLDSFAAAASSVPAAIATRLFLAFSTGHQSHPTLSADLEMVDFYQAADLVLFPSETEGRGLPIPEAAAAGVPLVCSRYEPEEVFSRLVGEHLAETERIRTLEFPEGRLDGAFLDGVTSRLLHPRAHDAELRHNRAAVRARFSIRGLERSFARYIHRLAAPSGP